MRGLRRPLDREARAVPGDAGPAFAMWIGGAWPPSADKRIGQDRRGHRFRTADYSHFLELVRRAVAAIGRPDFGAAWLVCDLHFVRPDRRRRDSHNTIKALLDALQEAGAFEDDLRVMPRIMSVRDLADVRAHRWIPHNGTTGVGAAAEPGVLVILYRASPETVPGSEVC